MIGFRGGGITVDSTVANLSGRERQGIAIGRAMHCNAGPIVLNDPTVALIGAVDAELHTIIFTWLIEFRMFLGKKPLASGLAPDSESSTKRWYGCS